MTLIKDTGQATKAVIQSQYNDRTTTLILLSIVLLSCHYIMHDHHIKLNITFLYQRTFYHNTTIAPFYYHNNTTTATIPVAPTRIAPFNPIILNIRSQLNSEVHIMTTMLLLPSHTPTQYIVHDNPTHEDDDDPNT